MPEPWTVDHPRVLQLVDACKDSGFQRTISPAAVVRILTALDTHRAELRIGETEWRLLPMDRQTFRALKAIRTDSGEPHADVFVVVVMYAGVTSGDLVAEHETEDSPYIQETAEAVGLPPAVVSAAFRGDAAFFAREGLDRLAITDWLIDQLRGSVREAYQRGELGFLEDGGS